MTNSILDHRPYPWPVKPMVLALLGLDPGHATEEQYRAAWDKALTRHFGGKSPKQQFIDFVYERMKLASIDYNEAWKQIKRENPSAFEAAWPGVLAKEAKEVAACSAPVPPITRSRSIGKPKTAARKVK